MIWKFPYYEINQAIDWDKIDAELDWFSEMKFVEQDKHWHGEGNVQVHTKMVIEEMLKLPDFIELNEQEKHILFTTALLHDVEKRSTTATEIIDGMERIVSPRHAKKGEFTARRFLYKKVPTPFKIREEICKLVGNHGLPIWAIEKPNPRKTVIEASLILNTKLLAIFSTADMLGRICEDKEDQLLKIELFKELCIEYDCYGKARNFESNYGRFKFLNEPEVSPDYIPFNDLKFNVYMLSAISGSGKDTYINQHFDLPILSLDAIRRVHKIAPTDKKKNGQVVQMAKEQAKEYMRKKQDFVFNATNLTKDMRSKWITLFMEYKASVKIIYLEVPYKKLLKQNHNRAYKVPEDVIERMIQKLEIPTPREAHEIQYIVS